MGAEQLELLNEGDALGRLAQRFDEWVHTPGARHVAKDLYKKAYRYAKRFLRTGKRVSFTLIWEMERDRIAHVRRWLRQRGKSLENSYGYALNNSYRAYMARHIVDHRPEWAGMFELREVNKPEKKTRVYVFKGAEPGKKEDHS